MALARARAAFYHDVNGPRHELAGACLADEHAVDAAPVVYHLAHLRVGEAKPQAIHTSRTPTASPPRSSSPSSSRARRHPCLTNCWEKINIINKKRNRGDVGMNEDIIFFDDNSCPMNSASEECTTCITCDDGCTCDEQTCEYAPY